MIAKKTIKKKMGVSGTGRFKAKASRIFVFLPLFFFLIFFLAAFFLVYSNWQMNQRRQQLSLRVEGLEEKVAGEEKKNEELKSGLVSAFQESYLEREAREKLQLKKPGEKVVMVIAPEKTLESEAKEPSKNIWEQILDKLGL